jgi:hypothetical protein
MAEHEVLDIVHFGGNVRSNINIEVFRKPHKSKERCCWWCCHPFDSSPYTLPTRLQVTTKCIFIDPKEIGNDNSLDWYLRLIPIDVEFFTWNIHGLFCSPNCVISYYTNNMSKYTMTSMSFIRLFMKHIHHIPLSENIPHAPPYQALRMFGGTMSIEKFRECKSNIIFATSALTHVDAYITIKHDHTRLDCTGAKQNEKLDEAITKMRQSKKNYYKKANSKDTTAKFEKSFVRVRPSVIKKRGTLLTSANVKLR